MLCIVPLLGCGPRRIEVQTNFEVAAVLTVRGEKATGSAVWQLHGIYDGTPFPVTYRVRGEAIRIELQDKTTFYVVKRPRGSTSTPAYYPFPVRCVSLGTSTQEFFDALRRFEGPCELPVRGYPALVTFRDESDPTSYSFVQYTPGKNDCGATEICLTLIIRRSDADVTTGIVDHLPWLRSGTLGAEIGSGKDMGNVVVSTPDKLYNIDFSTEIRANN